MRVSKLQVAANRAAILEAAARLFREKGFDGVSVAEVMSAAGLTHGGFYGHFASKDDLVTQAMEHVLAKVADLGPIPFPDYADAYLSADHRDAPSGACLFSSLGTEAIRSTAETRRAMTISIEEQFAALETTAPGDTSTERRRAAIMGWSAMVGAVMLARIADDPGLADEILRETRAALPDRA